MEIPKPHLHELSKFTDYDFALTHKVLEDEEYATFYKGQSNAGREVWLDNSFHELGYALPMEEILRAAAIIAPTHIVAPEVQNDARATEILVHNTINHIKEKGLPYKIIGTWWGYKKDIRRLEELVDVVALPFRKPRSQFVKGNRIKADNNPCSLDYHYFGFKSLDELRRFPPASLDSSICIKAAMYGIDLRHRERRPNTPLLDYDKDVLSDAQLDVVVTNIALLHESCKYQEDQI